MKKLLLFSFSSILLFTQCKKDEFPSETMSGENTFGCRVDGVEWTPKKKPNSVGFVSGNSPIDARFSEVAQAIAINAIHYYSETDRETISFVIFSPEEGEIHNLQPEGSNPLIGFDCNQYIIDTTETAIVQLTKFNEAERIVSGTFEFTAIGIDGCTDKIKITDGRFDLVYRF